MHVYHGSGTDIDQGSVEENDVVLTTYETAALDHLKGGLLRKISWFRVVLDEGMEARSLDTTETNDSLGFDSTPDSKSIHQDFPSCHGSACPKAMVSYGNAGAKQAR